MGLALPYSSLFIPGLESGATSFNRLLPTMESHGWTAVTMVYPNDGDIDRLSTARRSNPPDDAILR